MDDQNRADVRFGVEWARPNSAANAARPLARTRIYREGRSVNATPMPARRHTPRRVI